MHRRVLPSLLFASVLTQAIGAQTTSQIIRESGSQETTPTTLFNPGAKLHFDLTNLRANTKHGLSCILRTTETVGRINANCLAIDIFSPPDNGGDSSGIWVRQTGGGNAISAFALGRERPQGYPDYAESGFAYEGQADGQKTVYWSHTVGQGSSFNFKANMGSSGADTGFLAIPTTDTNLSRRAFKVANAQYSQENFYVDLAGNQFNRGMLRSFGLRVDKSIDDNGSGLKHVRATGKCTTDARAGAICSAAVRWRGTAFADTNYTATCTLENPTNVPTIVGIEKHTNSLRLTIAALTAAPASYEAIDCIGMHD